MMSYGMRLLALLSTVVATLGRTDSSAHGSLRRTDSLSHGNLRGRQLISPIRQYELWPPERIHAELQQWQTLYPNLVKVTTAQKEYGLQAAGGADDCPYDEGTGCLNYIVTIQDFLVHPEASHSSNRLAEVLWSGELHGNERVGPTAVMEAASLLLEAAQCESSYMYNYALYQTCSAALMEKGITKKQQQWLARLVATRRLIILPNVNAWGYYYNSRFELYTDVNRDFPFDLEDPTQCMQTIAARTLNEVFREHMFQLALTFHGGIEMIGYEWGADSFMGVLSPDDEAQYEIATAYSHYGGSFTYSPDYEVGPMDQIVYTIRGGMEDWAYAGSWIPQKVVQCNPDTYGGYPAEKTVYNDNMLRTFNMLVETSDAKNPPVYTLGTSQDVLDRSTPGNGHVSRNIRVALSSADLVEPYLSFVGVNDLALATDIIPLTERQCQRKTAVKVPSTLTEVTVEWTVGGALEIDSTQLYYGNWNTLSGVGCTTQPSIDLSSLLAEGLLQSQSTGTGYFSKFGVSPMDASASGESPLGPVFKATVDLTSYSSGDEIAVFVKARVDQSWVQQPKNILPKVPPQSHLVNARTNPSWSRQSNGKVIQGRQDWYSVIPLTLVISDTVTDLQDYANRDGTIANTDPVVETMAPSTSFKEDTTAPTRSFAPSLEPSSALLDTESPSTAPSLTSGEAAPEPTQQDRTLGIPTDNTVSFSSLDERSGGSIVARLSLSALTISSILLCFIV